MRSFLLVFYGNTGSSWLIQMLGSPDTVYVPGFEPLERFSQVGDRTSGWDATDTERLEWMRTAFSPPENRTGPAYEAWIEELSKNPHFGAPKNPEFTVAGFKMNSQSIDDHDALFKTLLDLESQVIVLERRNRIKHALSLYRYHEEGKSQFDLDGVRPPSEIDLEVFHGWVEMSVVLHRQSEVFWAKALEMLGQEALTRVQYEEFVDEAGKATTLERLTAFLSIEGVTYAAAEFKKATPDSLRAAVVNFDDLNARYRGTEFEAFLSE